MMMTVSARSFRFGVWFGLMSAGPWLTAQDVTVRRPVWGLYGKADTISRQVDKFQPAYPAAMLDNPTYGYAIARQTFPASGGATPLEIAGNHEAFRAAVQAVADGWELTVPTAAGKPVPAGVSVSVLFNPKAAAADAPDAAPRMIEIWSVNNGESPGGKSSVVPMKLAIDDKGVVTRALPVNRVSDALLAKIRKEVLRWKFAPAKKAGQAVGAEIVVPVLCLPSDGGAVKIEPPKAISQGRPIYPIAMRRYGITGEVMVEFMVSATGEVQNPVVLRSNGPAFDDQAIEAVLKWKFRPATREGQPTAMKMQVPIIFELTGDVGGEAFQISGSDDQAKLPPELRYDTPAKIRGVMAAVYPHALRVDEVRGSAKAVMRIDRAGKVRAVEVVKADRPEFGLALTAALETFSFSPALREGTPVEFYLALEERFDGRMGDDASERLMALEKKHPEEIVGMSRLDQPFRPLSQRAPLFPTAAGLGETGEALIEILVDKEGRARLPRIVSASAPAFGYAAAQAVGVWRFEPPKMGGKPVVARVQVPVKFSLAARKGPPSPPTGK